MATLSQYLQEKRQTQADFALQVGLKQSTISKLCAGGRVPSLTIAAQIAAVTNGAVPMDIWVTPPQEIGGPDVGPSVTPIERDRHV